MLREESAQLPASNGVSGGAEIERPEESHVLLSPENLPTYCQEDFVTLTEAVNEQIARANEHRTLPPDTREKLSKVLFEIERYDRMNRTPADDEVYDKLLETKKELLGQDVADALDKEAEERRSRSEAVVLLREAEETAATIANELKLSDRDYDRIVSELMRDDSHGQRQKSFYSRKLQLSPDQESLVAPYFDHHVERDALEAWVAAKGGSDNLEESVLFSFNGVDDIDWSKVEALYTREKLKAVLSPSQFERYVQLQKDLITE